MIEDGGVVVKMSSAAKVVLLKACCSGCAGVVVQLRWSARLVRHRHDSRSHGGVA